MSAGYDHWIWNNPNFPNKLSRNEDLILIIRQDVVLIIFQAIGLYLLFLLLLLVKFILAGLGDFWIELYDALLWGAGSMMVVFFTVLFHNYYLSLQIITSERIIDIDQTGIFKREINNLPLQNVQDVSFKKDTFLKNILNYGDVVIQSSGQGPTEAVSGVSGVVFNSVPNPKEVTNLIATMQETHESNEARENAKIQAQELKKVLGAKIIGS
jgi:hypothetical protein